MSRNKSLLLELPMYSEYEIRSMYVGTSTNPTPVIAICFFYVNYFAMSDSSFVFTITWYVPTDRKITFAPAAAVQSAAATLIRLEATPRDRVCHHRPTKSAAPHHQYHHHYHHHYRYHHHWKTVWLEQWERRHNHSDRTNSPPA
jgi:hypothetical protein